MFNVRLTQYKNTLGLNSKQLAEKLGIGKSYFSQLENGKKDPTKQLVYKLVAMSGKPEEYWFYGIEDRKEYIDTREELKNTKIALEQIKKLGKSKGLFNKSENGRHYYDDDSIEDLLVTAWKADMEYLDQKGQE